MNFLLGGHGRSYDFFKRGHEIFENVSHHGQRRKFLGFKPVETVKFGTLSTISLPSST